MRIIDAIRLSGRILKTNRVRTMLTILGVSVGIGAIVFLVSLGYGLQRVTIEELAGSDALMSVEVRPYGEAADKVINQEIINNIKNLPAVDEVEPVAGFSAIQLAYQAKNQELLMPVNVYAVNPNYFRLHGLTLTKGRSFTKDAQDEMVVTQQVVDNLSIKAKEAVGQKIGLFLGSINDYPLADDRAKNFTITGVANEDNNLAVYLPLALLDKYAQNNYASLKVKAKEKTGQPSGRADEVRSAVGAMGFSVEATIDNVEQIKGGFRIVRIILGTFGLIALLVAAIGMFNTMTVSLLERIREVGIMKSLGAANKDVWTLFIVESSLIGLMGGVCGLILGAAGGYFVNLLYNLLAVTQGGPTLGLFYTPFWFAVFVIVFSLLVGFLTGVYPARRAARLDPLRALRYE